MKAFGFSALSAFWLLLLALPVILFYFLKLKRPRVEVPSLVLWRQVMRDNRVNSPFQRFKRNLLLLLQLLLLALIALAAARPYLRGRASPSTWLPVLIDCSASMGALDRPGGHTRLEAGQERARALIDRMLPGQRMCLIAYSSSARRLTGFTDDAGLLRRALDEVRVEEVAGNVEEALRTAQALSLEYPFDELLLLSDGNFPGKVDVELSFQLRYEQIPAGGPNLGITAFNARRAAGQWTVFAEIEGSTAESRAAVLELTGPGGVLASEPVTASTDSPGRLMFRVDGEKAQFIEARLRPDGFDSLACDNAARLDLPETGAVLVHAAPSLPAVLHALRSMGGISLVDRGEPAKDLAISDQPGDLALPSTTLVTFGVVAPVLDKLLTLLPEGGSRVMDWRRDSPLFQYVELSDLVVLDRPRSSPGVEDADFENLGYEVLIHGDGGPLALEKQEGGRLFVHFLFHPDRTTLPYRVGFPVLLSNIVNRAALQAGMSEARANPTGVLPDVPVAPGRTVVRVTGPDGRAQEARVGPDGALSGIAARAAGVYTIEGAAGTVAVSLLSAAETRLGAVSQIEFAERLKVGAAREKPPEPRPLWSRLALAGLAVLLLEWWVFQRRPGGRRRTKP